MKDKHSYHEAIFCDKYRQKLLEVHAKRWTKYEKLDKDKKMLYFEEAVLYFELVDANLGLK